LLNRNKKIGNDLLVFLKVSISLNFFTAPLPYCCFGVPEKEHEGKEALLPTKHIF